MAKSKNISVSMEKSELLWGWLLVPFYLFLLPSLLGECLKLLPIDLPAASGDAVLNFSCYAAGFLLCCVIFRRFLLKNVQVISRQFWNFFQSVVLGLVFCRVGTILIGYLVNLLEPSLSNLNNDAITAMAQSQKTLMLAGTVLFAPVVEECIFRGLIFHNLGGKNKAFAYILSIFAFSAVHLLSSIGKMSPLSLALVALEYVPAGAALAWCYAKSNTIFTPILVHACSNLWSYAALSLI